ncbi:MAG: DUF1566 domain-containing protein [Spirochaetales bacterium]|nr:DUF1566 domain-containing protein [Spirochaetales bacterium]
MKLQSIILGALTGSLILAGCAMGTTSAEGTSSSETTKRIDFAPSISSDISYTLTDTMQTTFYDADGNEIDEPEEGEDFYGQDAQYTGTQPSFTDNGDGTVTDQNSGLMWQQVPDFEQYSFDDAETYAEELTVGGYTDWRLPTVTELYSIIDFRGEIVMGDADSSTPYIDTDYFYHEYVSDPYIGQFWSSTLYELGPLQDSGIEGAFGVNFGDGHIKCYETGYYYDSDEPCFCPGNFIRCVRGTENVYGVSDFTDNGDGTVSDNGTGLMWMSSDDETTRDWETALSYADTSEYAGYTDWRLPNVKELQSLVDYDSDDWPAIDEDYFTLSGEDSTDDATWLWSSTTHGDNKNYACYVCFGRAWSKENSSATEYYDWHGAGAQRSDPKAGDPSDYEASSENATDLIQIENYVLLVRDM